MQRYYSAVLWFSATRCWSGVLLALVLVLLAVAPALAAINAPTVITATTGSMETFIFEYTGFASEVEESHIYKFTCDAKGSKGSLEIEHDGGAVQLLPLSESDGYLTCTDDGGNPIEFETAEPILRFVVTVDDNAEVVGEKIVIDGIVRYGLTAPAEIDDPVGVVGISVFLPLVVRKSD